MTREQEEAEERLGLAHGRVFVREGYSDQSVVFIVPTGGCFRCMPTGIVHEEGVSFSVDWRSQP